MQLMLRNSQAKIRTTFVGLDGEATDPTNPRVTVTRDSTGDVVADEQPATLESGEGTGIVSYTLDPIDTVDLLRVEWSADDASAPDMQVSVVGAHLCTLEQLQAKLGGQLEPYELRALREAVERRLEDACGVAFRPSYHREQLPGDGTNELLLSRPRPLTILSATLDGQNVLGHVGLTIGGTVTGVTFPRGRTLDIAYVHGWPMTPEPVRDAALELAAQTFAGAGERVSRFREDEHEVWFTLPGNGRTTGIPMVDQVISDYGYPVVG